MWPSIETASRVSEVANVALVCSLAIGVVATALIVWMGNVKESYWDTDRQQSRERVAGLESGVAEANARAAEANQKAEEERLARVKIQAALASRRLTPEQSVKLSTALTAVRERMPIIQVIRLGDKEAFDFGADFVQAIMAAGVQVSLSQIGVVSPPAYGLTVVDTPDGLLEGALQAAGIAPVTYAVMT
jgi:hypothetical protein